MENKTGKYFKYAIGEIILVVIGILIALSINNWNEKRQNTKTLSIYTNQLIEEIEINIAKLDTVIMEESKLKTSGEFKLIDNIELRNAISSAYNSFEQVKLTQEVHYFNMKTRIADYFIENANYNDMMHPTSNFGNGIVFSNLTLSARATIIQKIDACKTSLKEMKQLKDALLKYKNVDFQ